VLAISTSRNEAAVISVLIAAMVGSISSRSAGEHSFGERLVLAAGDEQAHDGLVHRGDEGEDAARQHARLDLRQCDGEKAAQEILGANLTAVLAGFEEVR